MLSLVQRYDNNAKEWKILKKIYIHCSHVDVFFPLSSFFFLMLF